MAKKKRTTITVPKKTKTQLEHLTTRYPETIGKSLETLTEYIMIKAVSGDYDDLEPENTQENGLLFGDIELKKKATEKAKELGFKGTKDFLELIVRKEYQAHTRKATEKEAITKFTKVGNADDEKDE